jgi:hypothetical protein
MSEPQMKALSASRIKTLESCSWLYWCNYHLKLPKMENDGARKGTICHNIFELLLAPKNRKIYNEIIAADSIKIRPSIGKLITKYAKLLGLVLTPENLLQIETMILVGLKTDFFVEGGQVIKPEYQFEIVNDGPRYYIKGFIDKPAIRGMELVIDDFKSSKKQFSGEDHESNIQALIYSLAAKKIWPDFKPTVRFIFLQYPDNPIQAVEYNNDVLKGFELYLAHVQELVDRFSETDAKSNFAADKPAPSSGEFKGKLLCGFAKTKGQLKKDGTKMWHCDYKFPFDYWVVKDKNGNLVSTAFDKNKIKLKDGETIELAHYSGCPRFNSVAMNDLEAPLKGQRKFANVLDDF